MAKHNRAVWQHEQDDEMRVQHSIDTPAAERNNIEHRSDDQFHLKRLVNMEQKNVDTEDVLTKMREAQFFRAQVDERDASFVTEWKRVHDESLSEQKKRLQLRMTSDELRSLESKLRTAYCMKELGGQCAEKKLAAIQRKNQEASLNELVRGSWEKQKEEDQKLECEKLARKKQYGDELKAQMAKEMHHKELLFQDFLRERRLIDEAVQKINDEDHKAQVWRMEIQRKTKQEIEDFKAAQVIWRKNQQMELDEEHNRIIDYWENWDNNGKKRMEEQRQREETKAKRSENVGRQIYETEKKKKEREVILQEVAEEERLALQDCCRRYEVEKKIRCLLDANNYYHLQIEERKKRLLHEAAEETEIRQELMQKVIEEARVDQMNYERKRLKMIQLQRAADFAMEDRRSERNKELRRISHLEKLWEKEQNTRRQMIEDERLRMVKAHVNNLLGYIPFGVLRKSDLPLLGPEFVEMYGSKQGKEAVPKNT